MVSKVTLYAQSEEEKVSTPMKIIGGGVILLLIGTLIIGGILLILDVAGLDIGGEPGGSSLPSGGGGESGSSGGSGGTGTFKVAVYNDTSSYVTDVNLIIDGESVKQMTIYNGYWADWGTYSLEEGTHDIRLEVEYFDLSQNSYRTEVREGTEEVKAGVVYGAGYWITTSSILYKSYPGATMEPTPVEW